MRKGTAPFDNLAFYSEMFEHSALGPLCLDYEETARQEAELLAAACRAFDAYDQPCGAGTVTWESMSDESRRVWGRVVQAVLKSGDAP